MQDANERIINFFQSGINRAKGTTEVYADKLIKDPQYVTHNADELFTALARKWVFESALFWLQNETTADEIVRRLQEMGMQEARHLTQSTSVTATLYARERAGALLDIARELQYHIA